MTRQLPPDDDPRFLRWVNDIGPLRDVPPFEDKPTGNVIAAGLALSIATIGVGVAVAVAYALVFALIGPLTAAVGILGGTGLAAGALVYLVRRAS